MRRVSFAQAGEDVLLFRALGHIADGFWVDVGAGDPEEHSVTALLSGLGWRGINIEPEPAALARLRAARPRDVTLGCAVGAAPGRAVLHRIAETGLSTLDPGIAARHAAAGLAAEPVEVEVRTLAAICDAHAPGVIHVLKVDVEGAEAAVLAGADFTRHRPWVVLVEATEPNRPVPTHAAWEPGLLAAGYVFVWFDGLNRWYLAAEQAEALRGAFASPPNPFDGFLTRAEAEALRRAGAAEAWGAAEAEARRAAEARAAEAEAARQGAEAAAETARGAAAGAARDAAAAEARATAAAARAEASITAMAARLAAAEEAARAEASRAEAALLRLAEAEAARHAAEASAMAARGQVKAIQTSRSWRLTRPVRVVGQALRGHAGLALMEAGVPRARVEGWKAGWTVRRGRAGAPEAGPPATGAQGTGRAASGPADGARTGASPGGAADRAGPGAADRRQGDGAGAGMQGAGDAAPMAASPGGAADGRRADVAGTRRAGEPTRAGPAAGPTPSAVAEGGREATVSASGNATVGRALATRAASEQAGRRPGLAARTAAEGVQAGPLPPAEGVPGPTPEARSDGAPTGRGPTAPAASGTAPPGPGVQALAEGTRATEAPPPPRAASEGRASARPPVLCLDVTLTLRHGGRPAVGLVRVEHDIVRHLLARREAEVLPVLCDEAGRYRLADAAEVARLAAILDGRAATEAEAPTPAPAGTAQGRAQLETGLAMVRRLASLEAGGRQALAEALGRRGRLPGWLAAGVVGAARLGARGVQALLDRPAGVAVAAPAAAVPAAAHAAPLPEGAVLVSGGNQWDYLDYAALAQEVRAGRLSVVTVLYDVIAEDLPWVSPAPPDLYHRHWVEIGHLSSRLVAISEHTARQYRALIGGPNLIEVPIDACPLPLALVERAAGLVAEPVPGLAGRRFVLYVSTIETRKNHQLLLHAWDRLLRELPPEDVPQLVLVGAWGWGTETTRLMVERNWRTASHVQVLTGLPDEALLWLYRNAMLAVFPALAEGFGLGAAEAVALGTPCLVSDCPALTEATQGLMPALDPLDVPAWVAAFRRLFTDPVALAELRARTAGFVPLSPDAFGDAVAKAALEVAAAR
jgi:FkbM family methyltransferase